MNSFYYHYFLRKRGLNIPEAVEEIDNQTLNYMNSPDSVCEAAAGSLGISSLWFSSVPVIFSTKTFSLYLSSGDMKDNIVPTPEGICLKRFTPELQESMNRIIAGSMEPCKTPTPRPYALIRAAAKSRNESIEQYLRTNFRYEDKSFMDQLIRDVIQAGALPPAGEMSIADQGVIRDFAKIEDLSIDEAVSGFELDNENCFVNLMLAFRICVSRFNVTYNKDGSLTVSYPGYKVSDFPKSRPASKGIPDVPVIDDNMLRTFNDIM